MWAPPLPPCSCACSCACSADPCCRAQIRPLWRHYYQNTQGLIFVVDSNDKDRVGEAHDELHRMLSEDELREAVVLVFANKQDLPNAMSVAEVTDKLGLQSLRNRKWYIQATCATSGEGLFEEPPGFCHPRLEPRGVLRCLLALLLLVCPVDGAAMVACRC